MVLTGVPSSNRKGFGSLALLYPAIVDGVAHEVGTLVVEEDGPVTETLTVVESLLGGALVGGVEVLAGGRVVGVVVSAPGRHCL